MSTSTNFRASHQEKTSQPVENAGVGHNRAPAVKDEFISAIVLWIKTRDAAAALSRQQISQLDAFDRIDALRKAQIIHLAKYYRDNPKADVAPGVLAMIYMMADDDDVGASTLSHSRTGQIFSRNRETIVKAYGRLEASGAITRISRKGATSLTVPVVLPELVCRNHRVWLVDAIAPVAKLATCVHDDTPPVSSNTTPPVSSSAHPPVSSNAQVGGEGCVVLRPLPVSSCAHNFTKDSTRRFQCSHDAGTTPFEGGVRGEQTTRDKDRSGVGIAAALTAALAAAVVPMAAAASEPPLQAIAKPAAQQENLEAKLVAAAGAALANPCTCPGLLVMAEPRRWLAAGIDLEGIILPAIRARCATARPGTIKAWAYFTQAIADAQATSTAPMPMSTRQAAPDLAEASRVQRRRNYDMGERTSEQYLAEECIAKKRWTKAAVGLWGRPEDCTAVLIRLGAKAGEWNSWVSA